MFQSKDVYSDAERQAIYDEVDRQLQKLYKVYKETGDGFADIDELLSCRQAIEGRPFYDDEDADDNWIFQRAVAALNNIGKVDAALF